MWKKIKSAGQELMERYRGWIIAQGMTLACCVCLVLYLFNLHQSQDKAQTSASHSGSISQVTGMDVKTDVSSPAKSGQLGIQAKEISMGKEKDTPWFVDVKGAVKQAGIYQVDRDSRIQDAIKLAGGLRIDADVKLVNQSQKVTDEMVIYVPIKGEEVVNIQWMNGQTKSMASQGGPTGISNGLININQASETELMTLPGVGQKRAQDIIAYRETQVFQSIEDLGKVSGIGPKMLEKLTPLVTV